MKGKIDVDKLKELTAKGYNGRQIAEIFGVHHTAVYYWWKKLGLKRREVRKVDPEKFKELYRKGLTYREMAEVLDCAPITLVVLRKKLNLPSRSREIRMRAENIKNDIVEYVRRRGFCFKEEVVEYIRNKYGVRDYRVNDYILRLWRRGKIGRVKLVVRQGSGGGRPMVLKRVLRYSGLQKKVILYTDEKRLAEYLAVKLTSQLHNLSSTSRYARIGLKLALRQVLPHTLYEKVAVFI